MQPYYSAAQPYVEAARAAVARQRAQFGSWQVSNIIDDEHQYVDLVMEGGGVLGIALLGYIHVLEEVGIRFLQLGGASAGSINALLLAAAGPVQEKKTAWLLEKLSTLDLSTFMDGDADARDFVQVIQENGRLLKYLWKGLQVVDNLTEDFGLHPGNVLHAWLRGLLDERGISTLQALWDRRTLTPADGLRLRDGTSYAPDTPLRVALVTADLTTQSKVVFPEMAPLYYAHPAAVHPADFVRASLSIPLFFQPFKVSQLPGAGTPATDAWLKHTGYQGLIPESVYFVDGGTMSNFPIDLFHCHYKVPSCPTFGIKLSPDRRRPQPITNVTGLLGAIFDAARHVHDYDFITRNPDYRLLVSYADTDRFHWLDFNLSEAQKVALFAEGAKAASQFVAQFDWPGYQLVRGELLKAYQLTTAVKPSDALT